MKNIKKNEVIYVNKTTQQSTKRFFIILFGISIIFLIAFCILYYFSIKSSSQSSTFVSALIGIFFFSTCFWLILFFLLDSFMIFNEGYYRGGFLSPINTLKSEVPIRSWGEVREVKLVWIKHPSSLFEYERLIVFKIYFNKGGFERIYPNETLKVIKVFHKYIPEKLNPSVTKYAKKRGCNLM